MPSKQVQKVMKQKNSWVDISIGVYEIDFEKKTQKNLFSGFIRSLS